MRISIPILLLVSLGLHVRSAAAQDPGASAITRGSALDAVVAVQDMFFESAPWKTQAIVDLLASHELAKGVKASFRPVVWRVGGQWETLIDQASLSVEFDRGPNWRIEAGRIPSPLGLGMTENRVSANPGVLWCHRLYYGALPNLGPDTFPQTLASAVYPNGLLLSTSTRRWDGRVALVDRAPVDVWKPRLPTRARLNTILGGGFTPKQGVRIGAATARGTMASPAGIEAPGTYALYNLEGDWAFNFTRISGEWTRNRYVTSTGTQSASGWTAQIQQALTPRWFAHSRVSVAAAPAVTLAGTATPEHFRSADSTVGYRVTPSVTLRIGHSAIKSWTTPKLDHQVGISVAVAQRLW